ncbi:hypothetical protein FACS1894189_5470 [Planctomycetales bacterium]|nr:hypothetical protein FACS1894189_5470 [Planctomycetales bacterium]
MTFRNILPIFIIVLTTASFSISIAAENPFDALKGLNLKRKDEKKDDTAKPDTAAPQSEAEKKTEELVVKKTRPALENAAKSDAKTTQRVESATWLLLTGEYLFKDAKESTLWSDTVTSLQKGKEELEQLEKEIESDEEKRKELFKDENLAIRYDVARTRRETLEKKEQLARNEELDRLHQLRQILLAYTELTTKMSEADEYRQLGNLAKSADALDEAVQRIGKIKEIADSRKDYYLFKDEPKVEGDDEFKLLKVISPVFSQQLVVHLKTLHSATLFRLAILLQDKEVGNKLLDEAIKTAQDTLKETDTDNNVIKNPLLPYILGEAFLVKGLRITESEPASEAKHKEATPFFNDAITNLETAASLLGEPDVNNAADLKNVIKQKWDHLKNPQSFIDEAQAALLNGENTQALGILRTAMLFHRNPAIWASLLETAARVNLKIDELTKLLKDGETVITKDDLSGQAAIGRVVIALIEPQISGPPLPDMEKQTLLTRLELANKAIIDLNPVNEKNELVSGKATAVLAKLLTLQELLVNDDTKNETKGREAVRIAENSLASLGKETDNSFETFLQHEYKAIAYQAAGYNYVRWLPEHRKEGFTSYTAAMDELSKLPGFNAQTVFLGSPLLNAAGKSNGDKIAAEEQSLRVMLSKFIEGTFTLQFGETKQASELFEKALSESQTVKVEQANPTAAETFDKSSGFDTGASFSETLAAYSILADIAAGKKERALENCLKLLNTDKTKIAEAIQNVQSPLLAFALAKTLDEFVLATGINLSDEKKQYITLAKQAFQRGGQLMITPKLKTQYPHIVALIQQGNNLYADDNYFIAKLSENQQNKLEIITNGLKRHPSSKELWNQYITLQYQGLQLLKATDEDYQALLDELVQTKKEGLLNPFVYDYYEGFLRERLQQNSEALLAFERAVKSAETPIDSIKAQSKAGELRTRCAFN